MTLYTNDPLLKLMSIQNGGDHYNNPFIFWLQRIDEVWEKIKDETQFKQIDTPEQRSEFAIYLDEIYKPFQVYLKNEHPYVYDEARNGRSTFTLEWYALHVYLMKHGVSIQNVKSFIEIDKNDPSFFNSDRYKASNLFFGKCGIDKSLYNKFYGSNHEPLFERYKYEYCP